MGKQVFCALILAAAAAAAPLRPIPLWPNGAPGEQGRALEERDTTTAKDALIAGRPVIRLGGITNPAMTVYPAHEGRNTGAAVIVFPGGGYRILAMDLEGTEICEWLNSIGITGVLVKYRVPPREGAARFAAPLQDAQRAIGIVRSRATEWRIDPRRVGVLGFSAGAHLSAALSTNYERRTYEPVDEADRASCRPDFAVLIYPGLLTLRNEPHKLSGELAVTANTPPTFLLQAEDDPVHVENSIYYFLALKNAKVPAEMHIYAAGGHGYGLRPQPGKPVTGWPKLVEQWFRTIGVTKQP